MVMGEGRYISANGLEVYYREFGEGKPLILLHGATDTHILWQPFIPILSESFRVFTPDSRGHGRTLNPSQKLSYQVLADDLAAFIKVLDLEKPFLFGYSDGGQAVLDFGMRYPEIAGALVVGGAWYRFSTEYQDALRQAGFVGPAEIDFQIFEELAPPDWRERMRKAHLDPDPDYPETLLKNLAALFWTPLNYRREDFLKILDPTLILVGERDEMVPPEESREMTALIPGAEFAIIPGASHTKVIIQGGEFLQIVTSFLLHQMD
jgi:pimeloyl-ACP methyl ester carboxylesterase